MDSWKTLLSLLRLAGCFAISMTLASSPAHSERRMALLIGNSQYEHAGFLPNPISDVNLIAAILGSKQIGFEVRVATDLTRAEMAQTLSDFLEEAQAADIVLLFFAGHGIQFDGENYLLGVDARLETEFDLASEAIVLNEMLDRIARLPATALIFVDACRNNPLAQNFYARAYGTTRGEGVRGLTRVDMQPMHDSGMLLAFSASPGQVARDGPPDGNSPFARALANHAQTPGLELLSAMRRVMRDVREETSGNEDPQTPIFSVTAGFDDEIYLAGSSETSLRDPDQEMYIAAMEAEDIDALNEYLIRFPQGRFVALAEREIARLNSEGGVPTVSAIPDVLPLNRERSVRELQALLRQRRCLEGPIDGVIGPMTEAAVSRYLESSGSLALESDILLDTRSIAELVASIEQSGGSFCSGEIVSDTSVPQTPVQQPSETAPASLGECRIIAGQLRCPDY